MINFFNIVERFAPEAIEIMEIRLRVLRQILHQQPIGRRQLGKCLSYSERQVRAEIETLRIRGAVSITPAGIYLTPYGEELLWDIDDIMPFLFKIQTLAEKVKQMFNLEEVIIVPGDSYTEEIVRKDIGRAAAKYLKKQLYPGCILAVTGGSTLAEMANAISDGLNLSDILVVPARGGLGEDMEQQAGSIAARIAGSIGAQYRMLHIPDNLEENTVEILKNDIHVREVVNTIKASNILVHGIGPAVEMAVRRGISAEEIKYLQQNGASGEALRYYFDRMGKIIYEVPGIGLELADLQNIKVIIAVAGGSNKALAIEAVLNNRQQKVLITDEGAAEKIIANKNGKDGLHGS
ncbi:MAG: sugar-binding domain-containing protein [Syntrophomonadaceae bacterium]|nr:sugar-binding domain-containing protein [Syntrophomonadaceae bacterium]MDD3022809.1 sugar-binding domain-containing protein [Syntrophomonadaceae bacterium]